MENVSWVLWDKGKIKKKMNIRINHIIFHNIIPRIFQVENIINRVIMVYVP